MPKRTDIKNLLSGRQRSVVIGSTLPRMTFLAVAVVCFSSPAFAARAQVVVVVQEVRPSSQKPLITVLRDGAKQEGARLVVFAEDGQQKLTLTTDSRGRVKLPHVRPGQYCITASTFPTLRANLCLRIANTPRKADKFLMELTVQPPPPPTMEEKLRAAERAPIMLRTRFFTGTVRDVVGAVIARASVAVYRQGAGDAVHPLEIAADAQGHFAAALTPGKYTAVIQSPGFETQLLTFEISPDAPEQELNVKLNVGALSEVVSVARTHCNDKLKLRTVL